MEQTATSSSLQARVRPEQAGMRLDAFWAHELSDTGASRNQIKQWIRQGQAWVNDRVCTKPSTVLRAEDRLELRVEQVETELQPRAEPVHVVWQDRDVAVINKPAGLNVHPAQSDPDPTLAHRLVHHFPQLHSPGSARPGIVHRLDKDTSGLLLVALSEKSGSELSRALAAREVDKEYLALVWGCPEKAQDWIHAPIDRDQRRKTRMAVTEGGRRASSWYEVLCTFAHIPCSLLRVRILTGRTHQIRVHMAHIGHPVLGDVTYGSRLNAQVTRDHPRLARFLKRQMLHAWRLGFHHPESGQWRQLSQPVPKDFQRVLLQARRRPQRVGITGSAGGGKSALTSLLTQDTIPVWSADHTVAELYAPQADGWDMLRRSFGQRFVPDPNGPVDKQALFQAMQSSPTERQAILDLIHPLVEHRWLEFCRRHAQARMIVAEVPLLFEGGWKAKGLVDVAVSVVCPGQVRQDRLHTIRGWSQKLIDQMQAWQMPDADKAERADMAVSNAGTWQDLQQEAARVASWLRNKRRQAVSEFLDWLHTTGVM